MTRKLQISDDLALPLDAATQTFAFIARKGAGKTYAAGKLTEELLTAGVQCVILDTVGNWYGLRLGADGKAAGFDIPVLGGLRGDIPLDAAGGELIADIVVDTGRSLIIDLSQFSKGDRKRFATAFGERLWLRKKGEVNPSPLHLVLEECQLIVPQMVNRDEARMVGVYEEIIRLGRNYGIGASMITQRPQSVNKEVLTQTECLIVLQVNGVPERKAIKEWVVHQGIDVNLINELPSLPIGTAWLWSPQWLGILRRIKIGQKKTLDASSTPKVGEKRQQRELKPLHLGELQERMQAIIEQKKADDPKELRKRIAELERQIKGPTVDQLARTQELLERDADWQKRVNERDNLIKQLRASLSQITTTAKDAISLDVAPVPQAAKLTASPARAPAPPQRQPAPAKSSDSKLGKCERSILQVLSQFPDGCEAGKLTLLAGYTYSGSFQTSLSALRTAGLITGANNSVMQITDAGLQHGPFEPLPTGQALVNYWLGHRLLGKCERFILQSLIENPGGLTKDELCTGDPYTYSGSFQTSLSKLRTAGLIEGKNNETMTAAATLLNH